MGDVNLEIKLNNIDERVIKIEESGGGSGGDGYITSVSNDFNVVNKKLSLSNDVTTKLSKVDTPDNLSVELAKKIDKPASATNGQVLTYNGTSNEWEAKKPSASITEPTELEKGIIGGDEYNSTTTYAFDDTTKPNSCIKNNKIYTVKPNVTAFSNIEPTVTSGWEEYWEETSISKLKRDIDEIKMDLLWTNQNPTILEPTTINYDLSGYKCIVIEYIAQNSWLVIDKSLNSLLIPIEDDISKNWDMTAIAGVIIHRKVNVDKSKIVLDNAFYIITYGTDNIKVENDFCVPQKIYGIR